MNFICQSDLANNLINITDEIRNGHTDLIIYNNKNNVLKIYCISSTLVFLLTSVISLTFKDSFSNRSPEGLWWLFLRDMTSSLLFSIALYVLYINYMHVSEKDWSISSIDFYLKNILLISIMILISIVIFAFMIPKKEQATPIKPESFQYNIISFTFIAGLLLLYTPFHNKFLRRDMNKPESNIFYVYASLFIITLIGIFLQSENLYNYLLNKNEHTKSFIMYMKYLYDNFHSFSTMQLKFFFQLFIFVLLGGGANFLLINKFIKSLEKSKHKFIVLLEILILVLGPIVLNLLTYYLIFYKGHAVAVKEEEEKEELWPRVVQRLTIFFRDYIWGNIKDCYKDIIERFKKMYKTYPFAMTFVTLLFLLQECVIVRSAIIWRFLEEKNHIYYEKVHFGYDFNKPEHFKFKKCKNIDQLWII